MCGKIVWWWNERTQAERKCVVYIMILFVIVIALITLNLINKSDVQCDTSSCIRSVISILDVIDLSQNPCDDFYSYVCGKFVPRNGFDSISAEEKAKVDRQLTGMFSEPISTNSARSLRLLKQYYASCTNYTAIDEDDDRTFRDLIRRLGGWPVVGGNDWDESAFDLVEFMITLRKNGVYHHWFFDITVHQGDHKRGLNNILEINIPDNIDRVRAGFVEEYTSLMVDVAKKFGANERVADLDMKNVMYFENRLADVIELARNESHKSGIKEYSNMTLAEVQRFWQRINWMEFLNKFTNSNLNETDRIRFLVKPYLPWLDRLLRQTTKRTQVNYVIWKLIQTYAALLSSKIRNAFENYKKLDPNDYDLWYTDRPTYCLRKSRYLFPYALEAVYLRRSVDVEKRNEIQEIIGRIVRQLEKKLKKVTWMDSSAKKEALSKLRNITFVIGGPSEMFNVTNFDNKVIGVEKIDFKTNNIIDLATETLLKRYDFTFDQKNKPPKTNTFLYEMVTSTEAIFIKDRNVLYIPAGILQDSLYSARRPHYLNYGRLGAIIGHELSHGFNLAVSANWTEKTVENFKVAARCFDRDQVDGNRTVLETMADYTGLNLSLEAYQGWVLENGPELPLPGVFLTNGQLFWVAYASRACHVLNSSETEPIHALIPSHNRLANSIMNSPHFSVDFDCPVGSDMNPAMKCHF